jgi:hypothetical protein
MVKRRIIVCDARHPISLEGSSNVRFPGKDETREGAQFFVASEDASGLSGEASAALERAVGVQWYDAHGSDVDLAALTLCRVRRAEAAVGGAIERGDDAVRRVLEQASPAALTWIASRAISYMDENGYPDAVAPWFPDHFEEPPA